jgi:hypothetical protein
MQGFRSTGSIKWHLPMLLCLFMGSIASAQEPVARTPSGIEIIKLRWRKQVRLPNNFDPAKIPTRGVFVDPASKAPASLPGSGVEATRPPSSNPNTSVDSDTFFPATPGRLPVFYIYSMTIKNEGDKGIVGVAWDYVFIDQGARTEVGRHEFMNYKKIGAGGVGVLENPLRSPPTRVVKSNQDKPKAALVQRATIECILFADETSWRNPQAGPDICKLLASARPLKRKEPSRQN